MALRGLAPSAPTRDLFCSPRPGPSPSTQRERNMQNTSIQPKSLSKSSTGRFVVAALSLAAMLACGGVSAQTTTEEPFAAGRILLMPRAGLPDAALDRILKENGGGKARRIGKSELRIVELRPGMEKRMVERLKRHPHMKFAELDRLVQPAGASNDPYFGSAWHLAKIGAPTAWEASTGAGVTIAILDTGVDGSHADLSARMVPGWNFYDNNSNTSDVHGHGTGVAGAAAATLNNGTGVASIAGGARIMPVRIADANAWATWSTVAQGLTWAADQGARVANISYNGVAASSSVRSAAQYMQGKGGVVVVAAGNNNRDEGISTTTTLIPVSATDSSDLKASFSSWGNFVAVSAPGVGIWTTVRGGSYQTWQGTSLASPVAAAVVALMMARNPALSGAEVEQTLFRTAVDLGAAGRDAVFGHGRVNAAAAVAAVDGVVSTADTASPTASIGNPVASSSVMGLVAVDVSASDNKGVARVDLMVNGSRVASDSSAPFAFSWDSTKAANGMVELRAVAVDAAGNSGASAPVAVNVANTVVADTTAPVVAITSPGNGATVSGTVRVNVSASDNQGSAGISNELFIAGTRVATSIGGALSFSWNTRKLAAGSHTIEARARDAAGNVTTTSITVRR
jgi:thermitase